MENNESNNGERRVRQIHAINIESRRNRHQETLDDDYVSEQYYDDINDAPQRFTYDDSDDQYLADDYQQDTPQPQRKPERKKSTAKKKKKKKKKWYIPVIIVVGILAIATAIFLPTVLKVSRNAKALKSNLSTFVDYIKDKDAVGAEKALADARENYEELNEFLDSGLAKFATKLPKVGDDVKALYPLMDTLGETFDELLEPVVSLMKEYPLDQLKVGDGFNVRLIIAYLDFLEAKLPTIETITNNLNDVEIGLGIGKKIEEYSTKISSLLDTYYKAADFVPFLRSFIGNGEDRFYVFAAQNSAEIRASGGFPGSIGTIEIKDGILTIGDFKSVFYVMAPTVTERSEVTDVERTIFGGWIDAPRDACFIPDFTRVGQIWAVAYEDYAMYDFQYVVTTTTVTKEKEKKDDPQEDPTEEPTEDPTEEPAKEPEENALLYLDDAIVYGPLPGANENTGGNSTSDNTGSTTASDTETTTIENGYYVPVLREDATLIKVDGVVSLTPAIIQKMLKYCGEITLSDGSVLNGDNATKMLQHDLYFKYYSHSNYVENQSEYITDELFAETAKKTMSAFVSSFDLGMLTDFYEIVTEGIEENIVRIWMADENDQQIVKNIKATGELNTDPVEPTTGVYFSSADPSKMGWFLDIITEVGDSVTNEDGSTTYDVKVTLNNSMSYEEQQEANFYIIGSFNGGIVGYISFVAPAGGMITDFESNNGVYPMWGVYKGLEVGYSFDINVPIGDPIVFTYKVTTSPEAKTPLRFVTTPTLTKYR